MRALLAGAAICAILAPVVGLTLSSDLATAAAIALGGTAFVLLVSAAFYAIGRSEDRQRAREAADD